MSFSRWSDNSKKSIEDIINNILDFQNWHIPTKDPVTEENLLYSVKKAFDQNESIKLNGTDIEYNLIKYEYERTNSAELDNEMRSSRITNIQGDLLIYSDGTNTQYIMNRSNNSTTKTILRKINNYTTQGEIKESEFQITEDLFIWMISKILTTSDESIDENEELFITKIVGFKGSSDDQLAKVVGSGNRIMNALSTLAFLFENEEVMYVKPVVEYNKHEIELQLRINGSIDINFENYLGNFIKDGQDKMQSKLTLMTCLEIVPKILSSYTEECEAGIWSKESKAQMINTIGDIIQNKVVEKVNFLQQKSDNN